MIRFTYSCSSLFLSAGAILSGCAQGSIFNYNGEAKLQPVMYVDKTDTAVKGDVAPASSDYIRAVAELTAEGDDWNLGATLASRTAKHVRMSQMHAGIPVWGADVVVHSNNGRFRFIAGNRVSNLPGFDVTPTVAKETALSSAQADYGRLVTEPGDPLEYSQENAELVIYPQEDGETRLAWHVEFFTELQSGVDPGLWNYFIDAKTGDLISKFNALHHAAATEQASGPGGNEKVERSWTNALDVTPSGSEFVMETDRLVTVDMHHLPFLGSVVKGPLDNIGDAAINDAHCFAEITLNQLSEWQGFNSIDNKGFKIKSRVHYGIWFDNAFWNGREMTYGDGLSLFYPLSGALDVVAHEISHGFTSFHSNLTYRGESGGLNESFSDVAGTATEFFMEGATADWDLGADISKRDNPLRFMCEPTKDGSSVDDYANIRKAGDVHFSSGIGNKAFCLSARRLASGSATGEATQASVRRASNAWYHANAAFWTQSTTFKQGCQGILDAARDLGFTPTEQKAIRDSWADVGVACE